jgi:hypothetical protein
MTHNPLSRASEREVFQSGVTARRSHDHVDLELTREVTDSLKRPAVEYMSVPQPERDRIFCGCFGQVSSDSARDLSLARDHWHVGQRHWVIWHHMYEVKLGSEFVQPR